MTPEQMRERAAEIADKWTTDLQRRLGNGGPAAEIRAITIPELIGTHSPICHTWGPRHYECLMGKYEALEAALKVAADALARFGGRPTLMISNDDLRCAIVALANIRKITGESE